MEQISQHDVAEWAQRKGSTEPEPAAAPMDESMEGDEDIEVEGDGPFDALRARGTALTAMADEMVAESAELGEDFSERVNAAADALRQAAEELAAIADDAEAEGGGDEDVEQAEDAEPDEDDEFLVEGDEAE